MAKLAWDSKSRQERPHGRYVRERSDNLYHTSRWTRLSKEWRRSHPLCAECQRKGIIKAADVADHIIPWPVCGNDGFYDRNNLQSLCEACNHEKGQRDKAVIAQWRRERSGTGRGGLNLSRVFSPRPRPQKRRRKVKILGIWRILENGKQ